MRTVPSLAARRLVGAAVALALLVQGCGAAGKRPSTDRHPCGPRVDPATARTVDVYVTAIRYLLDEPASQRARPAVLYVVERAVPDPTGLHDPGSGGPAPATGVSASTSRFPTPARTCLTTVRFAGLPPLRMVRGLDDPAVRRTAGAGPVPRIADGRLVTLSGVPPTGDRIELAAGSNGGGGLDFFGGVYVLERRGDTWRVTGQERAWIA